jgi:predicted DNA-binding transcriptional regulator AlpA
MRHRSTPPTVAERRHADPPCSDRTPIEGIVTGLGGRPEPSRERSRVMMPTTNEPLEAGTLLDRLLSGDADLRLERVVSEEAGAELLDLSLSTMKRLRRARLGPRHVRLSERRVGYRVRDLLAWLEARTYAGERAA